MPRRFEPGALGTVLAEVDVLLADLAAAADRHAADLAAMPEPRRDDATNLVHYLAARRHDLRPLQERLRDLSLSSLGRMEPDVAATLQGVRVALCALRGEPTTPLTATLASFDGDRRLLDNTVALLGPARDERRARIMVTLPTAAADDAGLVGDLVRAGMDTARINLAHDDEAAWTRMAAHVRQAAGAAGRPVRILADLPGPKLRTGAVAPGPHLVKIRPERDALGRCVRPAMVVFTDPGAAAPAGSTVTIPLRAPLAGFTSPGDELVLLDTRERERRFAVVRTAADHVVATIDRTCYLLADMPIRLVRGITDLASVRLGDLPALPGGVPLRPDDVLLLTRARRPGVPAGRDADGRTTPATIPCLLPQLFDAARADQGILFDDGKIAGLVVANEGDRLRVRITATPASGAVLRAEKGINLPGVELPVPAITADDDHRLDWIAHHADLVGLSFVQRPDDVERLQHELAARHRPDLGVVLKIETAVAFQRLPELLLAGLRSPTLGVMVARGDLAVEVGFARLAEVQEEILWLCEAARVPVVWATQVLDGMARTGTPSRAEVTDAAMSVRAECVMLNKGPHIVPTVAFLAGVLERMQQHTAKKRALLRRLHVADSPAG